MTGSRWASLAMVLLVLVAGCSAPSGDVSTDPSSTPSSPPTTESPTATPSPTPTSTPTATPTSSPTATPFRNPWRSQVVVVAVSDENVTAGRDVSPLVEQALAYWNGSAARYGDYPVSFRYAPNATDPDVVVDFQDDVTCDGESTAIGCAPLVESDALVAERPQFVQVEAGYVNETTVTILKHEFGHLLGIEHGEPPGSVMRAEIESTALEAPDVSERLFPWRNRTLTVYVDGENMNVGGVESIRRHKVTEGLQFYATDRDDGWVDDVSFERTDDERAADVVVRASPEPPCDSMSCGGIYGHDTDDDGALEYYTRVTITVDTGAPDQHFGWHVAYWLGFAFGAGTYEDLPDDLRDGKRSGSWWADD